MSIGDPLVLSVRAFCSEQGIVCVSGGAVLIRRINWSRATGKKSVGLLGFDLVLYLAVTYRLAFFIDSFECGLLAQHPRDGHHSRGGDRAESFLSCLLEDVVAGADDASANVDGELITGDRDLAVVGKAETFRNSSNFARNSSSSVMLPPTSVIHWLTHSEAIFGLILSS